MPSASEAFAPVANIGEINQVFVKYSWKQPNTFDKLMTLEQNCDWHCALLPLVQKRDWRCADEKSLLKQRQQSVFWCKNTFRC